MPSKRRVKRKELRFQIQTTRLRLPKHLGAETGKADAQGWGSVVVTLPFEATHWETSEPLSSLKTRAAFRTLDLVSARIKCRTIQLADIGCAEFVSDVLNCGSTRPNRGFPIHGSVLLSFGQHHLFKPQRTLNYFNTKRSAIQHDSAEAGGR